MDKTDARKLKPEVQQQLRQQAIRLRSMGMTYRDIADIVGVYTTLWADGAETTKDMALKASKSNEGAANRATSVL